MSQHLSQQQIDNWVIGERSPDVERHLESCQTCAGEVERIAGLLTLFGGAVRSWGQEQMPPMRVSRVTAVTTGAPLRWWRMGLAIATLLFLTAIPVIRHRQVTRVAVIAAQTAAQDEILLRQVQQEISQSVPAPMESLAKLMPNDFSR